MVKSKVNFLFGGVIFLIALVIAGGILADMARKRGQLSYRGEVHSGEPTSVTSLSRTRSPARPLGGRGTLRQTPIADLSYEAAPAFTGRKAQDACICYERAFLTSSSLIEARARSLSRGDEYTSVTYISGYKACRAAVDKTGGNYWAHGWELGREGKFWRAKCPASQ